MTATFGALALVGVAATAALVGVSLGGTFGASAVQRDETIGAGTDAFDVNEYGQTIGEYGVGLRSDPAAEPELILAVGEDGKEGYVYTVEAFGAVPATPEEALENQAGIGVDPLQKRIPLYDEDGKTVIGTYLATFGSPETPDD
ncbi:hypothetical protein ACQ143_00120 [Microbacterium sp. MC2]